MAKAGGTEQMRQLGQALELFNSEDPGSGEALLEMLLSATDDRKGSKKAQELRRGDLGHRRGAAKADALPAGDRKASGRGVQKGPKAGRKTKIERVRSSLAKRAGQ